MSDESLLPAAVRGLVRVSRLAQRATGDLGIADFRVLAIIAGREGSASRGAARLLLSRPTIGSTLDFLARRGLTVRSSVPDDARATTVSLSEQGADLLRRTEQRMSRQT